jgi:CBS domain containing-hemolysin-like protein
MVPRDRLATVDAATPFEDMLRVVASSVYSRLPVYERTPENIVGVLHTKDVVTAFVGQRDATTATLLRPVIRVPGDMPADRLLAYLRERRSHQALVAANDAHIEGLVTLEDVVGELLGGVADEFKGVRRRTRPEGRQR